MAFFSRSLTRFQADSKKRSSRRRRRLLRVECLQSRQLLAADMGGDDLAALSDEFDASASVAQWQRVNEVEGWNADQLQVWNVDQAQTGRMVMQPHTVVWYENWRGPMAFKEVSGDFVFTSQVVLGDRDDLGDSDADDVPDDAAFSLGGIMIRTPRNISDPAVDWMPGTQLDDGTNQGENYVFLSMGHGVDGQFSFEVKTTRNSHSQLELTPLGMQANTATLRIAKIGDSIITLYQLPGEDWTVHRRYSRPDMPETMQLGLVTYSDWNKASDFDPFLHNSTVLQAGVADPTPAEPFNPDLVAGFEYARFARPQVPAELAGVDLVGDASDEQLLSFLADAQEPTENSPPVIQPVADQIVLVDSGPLIVDLIANDADADPVSFQAEVIGSTAVQIMNQHNLYQMASRDDYALNWGGQNEKWLQGDQGWYFLLPDGSLNLWGGDFESSTLLESFSVAEYDDPERLLNATDPDLVAEIVGDTLVLTPGVQTGSFQVEVVVSDGQSTDTTIVEVEVVNTAPSLIIADQVILAGGPLDLPLPASDADGHAVSYSVEVLGDELSVLDSEHGFWSLGDYYTDYLGQNERWIRDAAGHWHYLLPTGQLHRWEGSFESSPLLAELGAEVYQTPSLLTDPAPVPVMATLQDGILTITADPEYLGVVTIRVNADDGYESVWTTFQVSFVG